MKARPDRRMHDWLPDQIILTVIYRTEIEKFIRNLTFVRNKNPTIGEREPTSNSIGEIIFQKFSFDGFEYVAFGENFGASVYELRVLDHVDFLSGFYRGDLGKNLSPASIVQVMESIGVKGSGTL